MTEVYMVQLGDKKYYIEVDDQLAKIQKIEADFDDLPDFDDDDAVHSDAHAVLAPLPGSLCQILAKQDQRVEKDEVLFLCETMKMELEIRCPVSGILSRIDVAVGQHVEKNQCLAEITPE